jgi:hypothetical protein
MLPLPTDREANQSDGTLPYVRHRPERPPLYQLIEKYYPVFEAQCAVEDRVLPGMVCMPVLQEQKPVIKKAGQTHKMAHTGAVTLIQRFGSALKRSQGAIFNSPRLAP